MQHLSIVVFLSLTLSLLWSASSKNRVEENTYSSYESYNSFSDYEFKNILYDYKLSSLSNTFIIENDAQPSCYTIHRFELTKRKGTFYEARAMCKKEGGDLLHENFGFGAKKEDLFYAIHLAIKQRKYAWIGLKGTNARNWRFIDGRSYQPVASILQLFHWASKYPYKIGDCVIERSKTCVMKNVDCNRKFFGVCEYKRTFCLNN